MEATTMETLLSTIGTFFTQVVSWMGDILDVIVSNPALVIVCLAMPIIGFAVGLLTRLFRTN